VAALTAIIQTVQNMMIGISSTTSPIVLMLIEKNETGGGRMWINDEIRKKLAAMDSEDCDIAIRAAHKMAERLRTDMAVCCDLSVVPLCNAKEPPLEIVRFQRTGEISD